MGSRSVMGLGTTVKENRCVLLIFLRRKPDIPYDEFFRYWKETHGPLHANLDFVKDNIHRCDHVYKDVEMSEKLLQSGSQGVAFFPFDGMVLYEATSYDKLAIWNDPVSSAKATADRTNFASPEIGMAVGQVATYIDQRKEKGEGRVRMYIGLQRKPGMSVEQFQKHLADVHSKLYTNLDIVQKNILHYEQIHIDHAATAELAEKVGCIVPPFDGITFEEAESYEKILEVFTSPECLSGSVPDEDNFLDRTYFPVMPSTFSTRY